MRSNFIAAGEGAGGGTGTAIEVGVVSSSQLGFSKPKPISLAGETADTSNKVEVETKRPDPPREAEVLPSDRKKPPVKAAEKPVVTERPTANQNERVVSPKPQQGRSTNTNVEVGRSYGSPTPVLNGGIGLGNAASSAGTGGVPGGSEYGRRIQMILSRNYNPPQIPQADQTHYVIIQLRISRDGQIQSLSGGRVASRYIKQASQFDLVNRAAERAVLASNPLPPLPPGFLAGVDEAVAEIWFRYPK
jgi:outer membrane biosynthesis protein TonB